MKLSDVFKKARDPAFVARPVLPAPSVKSWRPEVRPSKELTRILALPRRARPAGDGAAYVKPLNDALRAPKSCCECHGLSVCRGGCYCCQKWGPKGCILSLLPLQAWALSEIGQVQGSLDPIGVGWGKTGIAILAPMMVPDVKKAILLLQSNLKPQFLTRDFPQWGVHFRVPNLGSRTASVFTPGLPVLHILAYSELSTKRGTSMLHDLNPELIIGDEAQNISARTSARTKRVIRYMTERPSTRCVWLSGNLTKKSLKEYAHLAEYALKMASPVPVEWPVVEEWAGAVDADTPNGIRSGIGALSRLCYVGEDARDGFRRRLTETPGVVSSVEGSIETSLVISERKPPPVPQAIGEALAQLNRAAEAGGWKRPDGEELVTILDVAECAKQLASGFFYRWRWPRMEPEPVIKEWLEARKEYHQEMRNKLKHSGQHLDSPHLLLLAATRWFDGYRYKDADGHTTRIAAHNKNGPMLTWESETFERWRAVRSQAKPETEAVWVSDYLVKDAAAWVKENVGIVWYAYDAFGRAVAGKSQAPLYGAGTEASTLILSEKGDRSVVASIRAHGVGKNLQMFSRQLVANPPSDGAAWEQMLGRTHRIGQGADEVTAEVYRHTAELRTAFDTAISRANYIEATMGTKQKLVYGRILFGGES